MQQTSLFLLGKSMPCVGLPALVRLNEKLVHCRKKRLVAQLRHAFENVFRYYNGCKLDSEGYSHQAKKETAGHAPTHHQTTVGHRALHVWCGPAPLEPCVTRMYQQTYIN